MWEKPKQGYLTLDEYNTIMDQSRAVHEEHAHREKKFMVDNADELAAKFNREKLKDRRAEYEAKQKQAKRQQQQQQEQKRDSRADSDDEEEKEEDRELAAAPFGQWQTVEVKEAPQPVDLQLPDQTNRQYASVPVVVREEPKVKVFKEKIVTTLDKDTIAADVGVFKKRKINITLKKNSRQRLDDY